MRNEWIAATLVMLTCAGCGSGGSAGTSSSSPEPAPADAPRAASVVHADAAMQQKWGIEVGQLARTAVSSTIAVPGSLSLDQEHTARITSLLEGRAVSIDAQVGDEVRKDQVLVTVHAPAMAEAKTAYVRAVSRLALARREFERAEVLLKQEAIDQREHLRRRSELDNASSDLAVAEINLHSYGLDEPEVERLAAAAQNVKGNGLTDELMAPYLRLTAPLAGHVIERDVVVGQHVGPEQPLLTISDLGGLWAMLDAREADLPHIASGQQVRIRTTLYPDRVWAGRVRHVGDVVDEKTRTVKVRVAVRNEGRLLKPNMFVQGEFPSAASSHDVLTVPEDAVQTIGGEPVVFVREAADRFAARPIQIGERVGARRAIVHGLDGSEAVVTAGAFNLKAELLKSTLAGE